VAAAIAAVVIIALGAAYCWSIVELIFEVTKVRVSTAGGSAEVLIEARVHNTSPFPIYIPRAEVKVYANGEYLASAELRDVWVPGTFWLTSGYAYFELKATMSAADASRILGGEAAIVKTSATVDYYVTKLSFSSLRLVELS